MSFYYKGFNIENHDLLHLPVALSQDFQFPCDLNPFLCPFALHYKPNNLTRFLPSRMLFTTFAFQGFWTSMSICACAHTHICLFSFFKWKQVYLKWYTFHKQSMGYFHIHLFLIEQCIWVPESSLDTPPDIDLGYTMKFQVHRKECYCVNQHSW